MSVSGKIKLMLQIVEKPIIISEPKPFLKWVGGKRQLLPEIHKWMPSDYNNYFEPFVGGGALFFSNNIIPEKKYYLNDYNTELVNVYKIIRDNVDELIDDLKSHVNTPEYYYQIRKIDREINYNKLSNLKKASRFIFLNKTGYNGLYRVNSKNEYNVPFGRYKNPKICDSVNLKACSKKLKSINIDTGDYKAQTITRVSDNDFVYFDPPYAPASKTSDFTLYTEKGFYEKEQLALKEYCDYLTSKNVKFLLSNSNVELIKNLYKDYKIEVVMANRAINCKASGRGKIEEVLIRNYSD